MLSIANIFRSTAFAICAVVAFTNAPHDHFAETKSSVNSSESRSPTASEDDRPSLVELKASGFERSRFRNFDASEFAESIVAKPEADLETFETAVQPLLETYCFDCHGFGEDEGNIQVDTLDPNLLNGADTDWWSEVFAVLSKEEMPPPDYAEMTDDERRVIVDWLSKELQAASILRRNSGTQSSFRRLTRYEYNYALQDLLGLPWDFASDLPPEPHSEQGFQNSSELLHLSVSQFETYHRLAREALDRATVEGEQPPTLYWGISARDAASREFPKQVAQIDKAKKELADEPEKLEAELAKLEESFRKTYRAAYYKDLNNGRTAPAEWAYYGASYAFAPTDSKPEFPADYDCVAILPAGRLQEMILELGNQLPDEGTMRVTVRASQVDVDSVEFPSLQLLFGWQASNEGRALLRVSNEDTPIKSGPESPQLVQWDVPLGEIYPRNSVRKTSPMGAMPSPSEYIRIANSSASDSDVQIDYVTIEAPVYDQWPPASHRQIFFASDNATQENETAYAREVIERFMTRAWRRPPSREEVDRKLTLFTSMRSQTDTFEAAVLEVLATVLSSPQFLYVARGPIETESDKASESIDDYQLATQLALFLWSSIPDDELLEVARQGKLNDDKTLATQVERMLNDPRAERLSKHFVHQWLNLELLEFVNFTQHVHQFDPLLKESMQQEPVALFATMLEQNASALDFVHSDYSMVNERLAKHYGIEGVYGNHFRRVSLEENFQRGGLLTQAGVLAMNSDWPDSHPLKRAIWLLECLLNDPPPPPPPAVPQIDLADPEIAKMTLKERIEDHRNHGACRSCHTKIDPWGIAFENYDALGKWRDEVKGKPVDAASQLFNRQTLEGMDGLKRYLLESRQDQFMQAMVHKLTTYGLGRQLRFEDQAAIDSITAEVRHEGDGLRSIVHAIVKSDLFQNN